MKNHDKLYINGGWAASASAGADSKSIRAGQVDINGGAFNPLTPFDGYKQSGRGREAGVYGMEEFLEYKAMQLRAPKAA